MTVVIFNSAGLIIMAIAFAVAFGIGHVFGISDEGPLMIIAGPLTAILDLAYRLTKKDGHWIVPSRGGSLFFLPVWCFGVLWLVLGIVDTVRS